MPNKTNLYYYLDINLRDMKVVGWGSTPHATLTGDTDNPIVYRVFLTKGQFNKLEKKLK